MTSSTNRVGRSGQLRAKKNETRSPTYTIHKNKFKVDKRLKYKLWHHKSPRGKYRQSIDGNVNHLSLLDLQRLYPLFARSQAKTVQIIFVELLKETPLISQDLMLYPLFLFGKGLRPEISICPHTHTKSVSFAKPNENVYFLLYNVTYIKPYKIYLSLNSVAEKKGDLCWWT